MEVNIQTLHFDADKRLLSFIHDRVDRLNHYHQGIIQGDVILKLDKNNDAENKVAEIKLHVSGSDLFAKRQCKSFEEAVDNSVDALRKQLEKNKTRR
ncbi:MAG: ribosome hibernation-promoting factor, HPF/YfiA family [Bacteroidota bacterium]|jgi:putative sigma-54 modulation protein